MQREYWGSRAGFILAAVGSAIGLGNIWRFPYVAYENGGGAFLLPYFFALATAGIPIVLLEYGIGHSQKGSAPWSLRRLRERWEWLGWFQAFICFAIVVYYAVIIAWALYFVFASFDLSWGSDADAYLFQTVLGASSGPGDLGGFQFNLLAAFLAVWLGIWLILSRGVQKGIERASLFMMPILILLMVVIVIRGLTLPGAMDGLNLLLTPDFSALTNPSTWVAAYGQVFFSLSLAMGVMVTYSSYLPEKAELNNSGLIMALSNASFEFFAALGVFSILGFMALQASLPVEEVVTGGVGLAFVAFPTALSEMGSGVGAFVGVLFFSVLVMAGLTSAISMVEVVTAALNEKLGLARRVAVNWIVLLAAALGLVFVTGAGVHILDIVDHYVNSLALVGAGLVEVILLAWFYGPEKIRAHNNRYAEIRLGQWWDLCLIIVTPLVLGATTLLNIFTDIRTPYGNYPEQALLVFGWLVPAVGLIFALFMVRLRWQGERS